MPASEGAFFLCYDSSPRSSWLTQVEPSVTPASLPHNGLCNGCGHPLRGVRRVIHPGVRGVQSLPSKSDLEFLIFPVMYNEHTLNQNIHRRHRRKCIVRLQNVVFSVKRFQDCPNMLWGGHFWLLGFCKSNSWWNTYPKLIYGMHVLDNVSKRPGH